MQQSITEKTIHEKLFEIQQALKAPKDAHNGFGGYNYRSAEAILEAVKPHLSAHKCTVIVSEEVIVLGANNPQQFTSLNSKGKEIKEVYGCQHFYIKATATISDGKDSVQTSSFARESENKAGMDDSQITGSASSYARKYALGGLFAIDDNKDADATNNGTDNTDNVPPIKKGGDIASKVASLNTVAEVNSFIAKNQNTVSDKNELMTACKARKKAIGG